MNLKDLIKKHEGGIFHPYEDTTGNLTIGWGRNLTSNGITEIEAEIMLEHDINVAKEMLWHVFPFSIRQDRREALTNMMFNLGYRGFMTFKKMIRAVQVGEWSQVAAEILDSKYATWPGQPIKRAKELAEMVK